MYRKYDKLRTFLGALYKKGYKLRKFLAFRAQKKLLSSPSRSKKRLKKKSDKSAEMPIDRAHANARALIPGAIFSSAQRGSIAQIVVKEEIAIAEREAAQSSDK